MSNPTRPGTDHGAPYSPAAGASSRPPAEKASVVEDFMEIFYAPSKVFARREKSGFGIHFVIVVVLSALFVYASRSLLSAAMDGEWPRIAAKMAENPQLTEEMIAQQRPMVEGFTKVVWYIFAPVGILLSAVMVWLFSKLVSAKLSYQQAALIVTLAWIPRLVMGLANTVQAILTDATSVSGMYGITYSPARFMASDAPRWLLGVASRFDLFTLWVTALIAIGIAVIGKVPKQRAAIAAILVWAAASIPLFFQ